MVSGFLKQMPFKMSARECSFKFVLNRTFTRRFYESHKNAGLQHGSRDCIVCLPGLNSKDSLRLATQRREGNWPERRDSNPRSASCVTGRRSKPGCSWGHPLRSSFSRRFELMKEIKMLGRISKCAVSPF